MKFTTPHCGMAMLTSSENVSEKLILPGLGAGRAGLLGVQGDKRWLSVDPQGPQGPREPASHSGQGENGLCPGQSSDEFLVARTPENMGKLLRAWGGQSSCSVNC